MFFLTISFSPLSSDTYVTHQQISVSQRQGYYLLKDGKVNIPYFETVKRYADEYGIDYRLILALIKQESQFNHEAMSNKGAYGLMQIVPSAAVDVKNDLPLHDIISPDDNVRAGIHYFSTLLKLFQIGSKDDQIALALASYNAGASRIYDAQDITAYLGQNPNFWNEVKKNIPLLSKRYYSLHNSVWGVEKPPNGYFGEWRQTVEYVDKVLEYYKQFCSVLSPLEPSV